MARAAVTTAENPRVLRREDSRQALYFQVEPLPEGQAVGQRRDPWQVRAARERLELRAAGVTSAAGVEVARQASQPAVPSGALRAAPAVEQIRSVAAGLLARLHRVRDRS